MGSSETDIGRGVCTRLMAVLLGGLGGSAVWQWRVAERAWDGEKQARGVAERARDAAESARSQAETARDGEISEPVSNWQAASTDGPWRSPTRSGGENNLAATLALLGSTGADFRGWEWDYVHRLCHSDLLTLKGHTDFVSSASFSRTGRGS